MEKILLIEDDVGILQSLKLYLESSDFIVDTQTDGSNAVNKIRQTSPDLIILDINLPNKSGIDICKEVRLFSDVPIIILTARSGELDKIEGLEIGADDYIAKPFSPRELLARIKNSIKRSSNKKEKQEEPDIEDGNFIIYKKIKLDIDKMKIYVDKKEIQITKNEFDIAKKIFEENGKLVSREILMKQVIGYDQYIYDRTLDTHVKNLRKKIGDKDIILTIRGEGYRLNK